MRRIAGAGAALACAALLAACQQDMANQPRHEPLEQSRFFKDGRSSRPLPEGAIARGMLRDDELLYTGKVNGETAVVFPFAVTREVLERGRQRFNIFCTPCHGMVGSGDGMVVERGFRRPPSYHIDRLREAPAGHFYDVITNGFGAMQDLSGQVPPRDRWAIVAYIRALQLSQQARMPDLSAEDRNRLQQSEVKQ